MLFRSCTPFLLALELQVTDPESASFGFPSGGGFSNVFPRPHYQTHAVSNYFQRAHAQLDKLGPNRFNRSGRGIPDVSANGFPTVIAINGSFALSGGSSASTPIFAAMIAAVNDARFAAGKGPVGFINPAVRSTFSARCTIHDARADECARSTALLSELCGRVQ